VDGPGEAARGVDFGQAVFGVEGRLAFEFGFVEVFLTVGFGGVVFKHSSSSNLRYGILLSMINRDN